MNRGRIIALDTPNSMVRRYGGRRTVIIHDASLELAVKLRERHPEARILSPDVSIEVDGISEMVGINPHPRPHVGIHTHPRRHRPPL